ncbi:hypothetical protein [Piscinibacter sp.]|uniref:hypothetical protein n=1 Tax=Piscinibacter sp. TaxID=1903157 RepID=UPI002C56BA7F|nr:hypothetical protein [Albitalea sp.]HUG24378.1 hypothetical protein [Albitalea sp.]
MKSTMNEAIRPVQRRAASAADRDRRAAAVASSTESVPRDAVQRHKLLAAFGAGTIQCEFSERVGAYMVVVRDSALRHLNDLQMRAVVADARFAQSIAAQYAGAQVDRYTVHVGAVTLMVNIYPAGDRPPVVEVFHSDAGYQQENKAKARDRFNSLYGGNNDGKGGGTGGGLTGKA